MTSTEDQKKIREFIDIIHSSIKVVSDYGAVIEKGSEEKMLFIPESNLPYSKEEIKSAIECIEFFIKRALVDERIKNGYFEHHAATLFGEKGAGIQREETERN